MIKIVCSLECSSILETDILSSDKIEFSNENELIYMSERNYQIKKQSQSQRENLALSVSKKSSILSMSKDFKLVFVWAFFAIL